MSAADDSAREVNVKVGEFEVPKVGLGTWNLRGEAAVRVVKDALAIGYRHIDTAEMYGNEAEIGRAIEESSIPRDELFLVSKVWKDHMQADELVEACRQSCARLRVERLDMYLVHWPNSLVPIEDTMAGMDRILADGMTRMIGVSNFSQEQWDRARQAASAPVTCNQVKFSVHKRRNDLVAYASGQGLMVTAYTPLEKGRISRDSRLREIADAHGQTPIQVGLRWLLQQGPVAVIPKSSSRDHLEENLGALSFALSPEEMVAINGAEG